MNKRLEVVLLYCQRRNCAFDIRYADIDIMIRINRFSNIEEAKYFLS